MIRNDKEVKLPVMSCGLIKEGGVYFMLPLLGVSLNTFKKMHHGQVKHKIGVYKSILDIMFLYMIKNNYIKEFNKDGIIVQGKFFSSKIDVEWILTFDSTNMRDVSNYTQKTLLDAVVRSGIIEDDNSKFVKSDKTSFGNKKINSITCLLLGEIIKERFYKHINVVSKKELGDYLGI